MGLSGHAVPDDVRPFLEISILASLATCRRVKQLRFEDLLIELLDTQILYAVLFYALLLRWRAVTRARKNRFHWHVN